MALPSSGAISMSQINTEMQLPSNSQINLNDPIVRAVAGVSSGTISLSDFYGKEYKIITVELSGLTRSEKYSIDDLFTSYDRIYRKCVLNISSCKLGGGDRTNGSLYSVYNDWHNLTVNVTKSTYIAGTGGNGRAAPSSCGGSGQTRTDGGHGITFSAGTNVTVNVSSDSTVAGGGAGGDSGWYVACGYSNSGTGGAGGGGAGFPAGVGGPHGTQNGTCYCSSSNKGGNGGMYDGGAYGKATGWGSGCSSSSTVAAQHGSRGGSLGQPASRTDGCYPISAHGSGGSAIVNAKTVYYADGAKIFGVVDCMLAVDSIVLDYEEPRDPIGFTGNLGDETASIPIYEDDGIFIFHGGDCPECPSIDVTDMVL